MRHRKRNNHLKRKSSHRKSMLANMSCSLIMHKRIKTTLAKAKALKTFVEPIITRSKNDTTHNRRMVFRYLRQKEAVTELFSSISEKVANRPGGYTRIIKLGNRLGDSAEMCFIELVDFNETYIAENNTKKTRRSRRSDKKRSTLTTPTEATPTEATPTEETPTEATPTEATPTEATPTEATPTEENSKTESGDEDRLGVEKSS